MERTRKRGIEFALSCIEKGPEEIAQAWRNIDLAYGTGNSNSFDIGAKETLIRHGHSPDDGIPDMYSPPHPRNKQIPSADYTNNVIQFPSKPSI